MRGTIPSGVFVAVFLVAACRASTQQPVADSNTQGVLSHADDLIPIPKVKSSVELKAVGRSLAKKSATKVTVSSRQATKPKFKAALMGELRDAGGIPRHQQKDVLERLLDPSNVACGGANCARVLGMKTSDVEGFLDETEEDVKNSKVLLKPELRSTRRLLLGSFKKEGQDAASPARKGPGPVVFDLLQKAAAKELHISPKGFNVTLDIKPSDLLRTEKLECFKDLCEATLHVPLRINADVPLSLNSQVRLTYAQKADNSGLLIEQTASIKGQVTPIKIHQILSLAVEFGADFEKSASTEQRLVVKDVKCTGTLSCELPIVSLSAVADKDGLTFNASTKSKPFDAGLVKVSQDPRRFEGKLKYADVPKAIKKIQQGLDFVKTGIRPEEMDILWEQFSDLRGSM